MGPYCNYCQQRCFVRIPQDAPAELKAAYGTASLMATCARGIANEQEKLGYSYKSLAIPEGSSMLDAEMWLRYRGITGEELRAALVAYADAVQIEMMQTVLATDLEKRVDGALASLVAKGLATQID